MPKKRELTNASGAVLTGRVEVAFVDVDLALGPSEPGLTLAGVLVYPIPALCPILAGVRLALVNVNITIDA